MQNWRIIGYSASIKGTHARFAKKRIQNFTAFSMYVGWANILVFVTNRKKLATIIELDLAASFKPIRA